MSVKDQNSLSGHMKPATYVSWSKNDHALTMIDANADNKEGKLLLVDSDIALQPQLAVQKVLFSGNKNKTGSFDRVVTYASVVYDLCNNVQNENYGNVMNTEHCLLDVDRNYMPISLHISPLMVRDKPDSDSESTIMDLSWPKGNPVNNGVLEDTYLDTEYLLKYPSVDRITTTLKQLGPAAMIYKVDISRAFRQIKIDPADIDLLGFKLKNKYFLDLSIAFGYHNGSQIFQRCADAICFIMSQHGFHHLHKYIDELIYTGLPSEIHRSYEFLTQLLADLGLDISLKKLVPPTTSITCLGIQIDAIQRTISITHSKLQEIVKLCHTWTSKTYYSKKDLQSLLGSLLYITKCVAPARYFLNRMLKLLRLNAQVSKILLTQSFFRDLAWFNTFMATYNGIRFYDHSNH